MKITGAKGKVVCKIVKPNIQLAPNFPPRCDRSSLDGSYIYGRIPI